MTNRSALVVASIAASFWGAACTKYIEPTPLPEAATVSGRLLVHSAGSVAPAGGTRFYGWVEGAFWGRTTGSLTTGADGSYEIVPSIGATAVRVNAMSIGAAIYQPCAATVSPLTAGRNVKDVHLISDLSLLGANLPDVFMSQGPLLTGTVFETTDQGREPVANAFVGLDANGGEGLVVATTLTDSDGRFVLCAVPHSELLFIFINKEGYEDFGRDGFAGASKLDIELRRRAS